MTGTFDANRHGNFIAGAWREGCGMSVRSVEPATSQLVWHGTAASPAEVDDAIAAARKGFIEWSRVPFAERLAVLERFAAIVQRDAEDFARLIARETGKPLWEARTEVGAISGKVGVTKRAWDERAADREVPMSAADLRGIERRRPLGVCVVFGPFNLPAHLPNGHIVPALLAGNSVVFKPSEQTPAVGMRLVDALLEAGVVPDAIQLTQGARETGIALVENPQIAGVFFTGSSETGAAIHRALGGRPEVVAALEMGGNNPLVAWGTDDAPLDAEAAAFHIVQSAFITAGQRCTCARRLIVPAGSAGDVVLDALTEQTRALTVGGPFDEPQPFIGPLISPTAAVAALSAFDALVAQGGEALISPRREGAFLTPGIVDVSAIDGRSDDEIFGPVLQVIRAPSLDAAIELANETSYGLSAGFLGHSDADWQTFLSRIRAGIVNRNRATTGASGAMAFGGVGRSGNHRPAAWMSVDYCAYPMASMESATLQTPASKPPGLA